MLPVNSLNRLQFYKALLETENLSEQAEKQERLEKDQTSKEPIEKWRKKEADIGEGQAIEADLATTPKIPPNGIIRA